MCPARLGSRVRGAEATGLATLPKHVLRWHKRSKDGSGKCNVAFTGDARDQVIGVLYEIPESERPALNRAEGKGHGYELRPVQLATSSGSREAETYVATSDAVDDSLKPYDWYRDHVLCGARDHHLPQAYVDLIASVGTLNDPDSDRAHRERASRKYHAAGKA